MTSLAPSSIRYKPPTLYALQQRAIFDPARFVCIEASTKSGKTVGCMVWLVEEALAGTAGDNYWWIAPIRPQAKIVFRRLMRALPTWFYSANLTDLTLTLPNGAILTFKSAENPDSLYGDDVRAVVIDEASRCKPETWPAIRSTLTATRGKCRLIGNVKGRINWFYRLARRAERGARNWAYHKITAWDAVRAGVLASSEVRAAKRELPEYVWRELYLAEASDDQSNPFGFEHIRACLAPLSADRAVAYGVDLASKHDYTVVIGLDRAGRVCFIDRWRGPWGVTVPRILGIVGSTPTLVDQTGVGDSVVETLQGATHNVTRNGDITVTRTRPNIEGVWMSAPVKQSLIESLAVALQQHEVTVPDSDDVQGDGVLRAELESFEYVYTAHGVRYSAPEGLFDDAVIAFALGIKQWRQRRTPALPPVSMGVGGSWS